VCEPAQALYLCASASMLDDSGGTVRYVHQLLQEYFVAVALQDRMADGEDLGRYWPDGWTKPSGWEETFVLLAGMLPDMASLVGRLVDANPALAARCIGKSGGKPPGEVTIKAVKQRLAALATSVRAAAERNAAGDALNYVGDPRPGVGLRADGVPDIVWCAVPAGEFIMGSTDDSEVLIGGKETPQHRPNLPAFAISQYPITNAQFDAFVQDGGYIAQWRRCWTEAGWQWKGERRSPDKHGGVFDLPNHPVVMVTWYEAVAFCGWLSQKLGRPVSLPSEAQWERAARHTNGRRYPWGDQLTPDHCNYNDTGIGTTTAVGIFPKGASQCGALDMSGNVWEWTRSLWGKDWQKSSFNYPYDPLDKVREDLDAPLDILRVVRGGSFSNDARDVRCAIRDWYYPSNRSWDSGFGVVVASPSIHDAAL
jgi:formylglycine-generating enzyme required for sulfatase activity